MSNENWLAQESIDRLFALATFLEQKSREAREAALNLQWTLQQHFTICALEKSINDPNQIATFAEDLDNFVARIEMTNAAEQILDQKPAQQNPVDEMVRIWSEVRKNR
jgi:hypothetical protein